MEASPAFTWRLFPSWILPNLWRQPFLDITANWLNLHQIITGNATTWRVVITFRFHHGWNKVFQSHMSHNPWRPHVPSPRQSPVVLTDLYQIHWSFLKLSCWVRVWDLVLFDEVDKGARSFLQAHLCWHSVESETFISASEQSCFHLVAVACWGVFCMASVSSTALTADWYLCISATSLKIWVPLLTGGGRLLLWVLHWLAGLDITTLQAACTPFASHALQTLPFHSHLISHALHLAHAAPFTLEVVEAKAGTCSEWRINSTASYSAYLQWRSNSWLSDSLAWVSQGSLAFAAAFTATCCFLGSMRSKANEEWVNYMHDL